MENERSFYGSSSIHMGARERKKMRERIIRGGRIADEIREMSNAHHNVQEIPSADKTMRQKLEENLMEKTKKLQPVSESNTSQATLSFWQKVKAFLKYVFVP